MRYKKREAALKKRVVVMAPYYAPGWKAGGPIQTASNMVAALGKEYDFFVVTRDRDLQDTAPYRTVLANQWVRVGPANVLYVSPGLRSMLAVIGWLRRTHWDVLLLNSFFDFYFSILPVVLSRIRLLPQNTVLLGPRGEFSPGALRLKAGRKKTYIWLANLLTAYGKVTWLASTSQEAADIRVVMGQEGQSRRIFTAIDIPSEVSSFEGCRPELKRKGAVDLVFLSRISRKKNLDGALNSLQGIRGNVSLNIYGPAEDAVYWRECQSLIAALPPNISVHYWGPVSHDEIPKILAMHHFLFLPTHGENFGHVIAEALAVGQPVLISDQTPWRDLEAHGAGWDIALGQPERLRHALQQCVDMDAERYAELRSGAAKYSQERLNRDRTVEENRVLLETALPD